MIRIANVTITRFADLNEVSTADLLAYYNSVTGKNTKQFLKRAKGMQQVWALIEPQLAQDEGVAQVEPAEVAPEQPESVESPATPATAVAAPATAPSTAEEPAEGAASAEAKAKPAGLKARVDDLLAALASGPRTIAELAEALGMEQKKVRSTIDTARRVGHTIACVGRGTFALPEAAQ
ncbi:hypothetical protein I4970_17900 [Pseudomonas aeruginosa]|uniref:hypothetical protein n=1 Tax=Pseudomonas aeruginosa TaxID=287 RepID=UPI0018C7F0B4|nr:hypothetical protein [Pseudomonas aeruginosa]MBG5268049.1 hypothetical protein [Pseudomonas aeruginosa]MBR7580130.1 hypothetical protein [Pseudomonas aeruginosa]HBO2682091.1 hypothetical protein [Pseudomonas aeruginosa]HEJ6215592.1 hypothetical protein [Pseudomonas aeruginosa]